MIFVNDAGSTCSLALCSANTRPLSKSTNTHALAANWGGSGTTMLSAKASEQLLKISVVIRLNEAVKRNDVFNIGILREGYFKATILTEIGTKALSNSVLDNLA
jgi:hypothetical protein